MNAFRLAVVGECKGPHMFDITELLGKGGNGGAYQPCHRPYPCAGMRNCRYAESKFR